MSKQPGAVFQTAAAVLAIGVAASTALRSADDEEKKAIKQAQAAIFDVADTMRKDPAPARKKAAALAKKADLENVMHAFKQRSKGGIGVGPAAGAITPDWIDRKISA